jgi:hypothetical protein
VPEGDRWHRELLAQCTVEVPGVRPAVLPREMRQDLESLLAFRHFVRHAYGAELDPEKLAAEGQRLRLLAPGVAQALEVFGGFLNRALQSAAGGS